MPIKKCDHCKWAMLMDWGYSNYTVEGTEFYCLKQLHPNGNFDRFYGEDSRLNYAEQCDSFDDSRGPVEVDVDRETLYQNRGKKEKGLAPYSDDPEVKKLLENYA